MEKEALPASQKVLICRQTALYMNMLKADCSPNLCYFAILLGTALKQTNALRLGQEFSSQLPKRPNRKDHVMVSVEL